MTNTRARVARIGSSFFKQKTAYEMRISDWSSDVCSSDLHPARDPRRLSERGARTGGLGPARGQGRGDRPHRSLRGRGCGGEGAGRFRHRRRHARSEDRRDGKECVSTYKTTWSPSHSTTIKTVPHHMMNVMYNVVSREVKQL